MLETSKDFLFVILSFSVLLLTFCFVWLFYYIIKIIKDVSASIDMISHITKKIDDLTELAKDKLKKSTSYFLITGELIKCAMDYFSKKQNKKNNKTIKK